MRNTIQRSLVRTLALFLMTLLTCTLFIPSEPVRAQMTGPFTLVPIAREQTTGKMIVVDLSEQWLYAYEDGHQVFNTAVLTGRSELGTPTGTYQVFAKRSPTTFTSPFPRGSAEWYPPTFINYALEWKEGGFFLHDSSWHSIYGPGTNRWHYDPIDGWQSGSHGCVSMPLGAAAWLYQWAPIGTTVQVRA